MATQCHESTGLLQLYPGQACLRLAVHRWGQHLDQLGGVHQRHCRLSITAGVNFQGAGFFQSIQASVQGSYDYSLSTQSGFSYNAVISVPNTYCALTFEPAVLHVWGYVNNYVVTDSTCNFQTQYDWTVVEVDAPLKTSNGYLDGRYGAC
ncbi:hypothetical protein HDU76_010794 [Blyttiomyces sp. JEL0837]|nr:hypothetical protein HDU76_010794 [Blyttiomyces sp. JEL0837]